MPDFVAFDLETTGLSPRSDRVIEIGAVRFGRDWRPIDRIELLVDPGRPIPLAVQRLTGITDADLEGGLSAIEAMAIFADFCAGAALVAHGAAFDLHFCAALLPGSFAARPVIDTLELARILLPSAPSHSLPTISRELGIEHVRPHRAGSDADATRALLGHVVGVAERLPPTVLGQMRALVAGSAGALPTVLLELVEGAGIAAAQPSRRRPSASARAPAAVASEPLPLAAARALGPVGVFAAAMPAFELRDAQVEMATAVSQTLERSGRLVVEAGTGIGKSLAYLVPIALWSSRTGRRAVVATHTITLQEQLGERDLPVVVEQLGLDLRHAVLKGRQHYISLRRWERFLATPDHGPHGHALEVLRFKLKMLVWLSETPRGDRAELHLAGQDEALWRRVQSDSDDCLGPACANWRDSRCFMVSARRRAAAADIVVTNHALVLADAERQGQVLSAYSALIVDEAHHLEEAATHQFGARLRAGDIVSVVDRLRNGREPEGELETALARARDAAQRLFGDVKGFLGELLGSENPGNATVALGEELRARPAFASLVKAAWHAVRVLREAASALVASRGRGALQSTFFPQPDRVDDELELAAAALNEAALVIEQVVLAPREGRVAWLALRAEQAELHDAPIAVADDLQTRLFDRADSVVLTSATLSVAGSFAFTKGRTGVGEGAAELVLASPFNFLSQALCVLPSDVPPYDDAGYDSAVAALCADLAVRLGGRTLILFTGYSPLRSIHALLRPRLEAAGIAVLGQGLDGTRRQVLASFLQNQRTVLLGTSTFWEGIDVPGDALRCVVIAKLPFPVPSDPLVQARGAALRDPFAELALPIAVLRLKQGFGRLIRRSDDRGAVVLCDARLSSRDYGQTFLSALPEAMIAREPLAGVGEVVERFVGHGDLPPGARTAREPAAAAMEWA